MSFFFLNTNMRSPSLPMVPQWLEMVVYIKASKEHHAMGPLISTYQAGQHINLLNIKVSFVIHI